jgi:hypothetical protein
MVINFWSVVCDDIHNLLFIILFTGLQNLVFAGHVLVNKRFSFDAVEGYEGTAAP